MISPIRHSEQATVPPRFTSSQAEVVLHWQPLPIIRFHYQAPSPRRVSARHWLQPYPPNRPPHRWLLFLDNRPLTCHLLPAVRVPLLALCRLSKAPFTITC